VLWLLASTGLLLLGFALVVAAVYLLMVVLGNVEPSDLRLQQTAAVVYFRVIFLKGLLPQLLLTLALWPALSRILPWAARGRAGLLGGLAIAAALAYAVVAPLLLTTEWPIGPALRMEGPGDQLGTALLMSGAVALAAFIPRLRSLRRRA